MNENYKIYTFKSEADKAVHMLEGILKGMSYDQKIHDLEVTELRNWLEAHIQFKNKFPFKEIIDQLEDILSDGVVTADEKEDLLWFCNKVTTDNDYYDITTSDMQRLYGILHGIISDKTIADSEIVELKKWLLDNEHLASVYPYDELTSLLVSILADGKVSKDERALLERHILEYVDTSKLSAYTDKEIQKIKNSISISGICALDPEINFENASFCFTGKSSRLESRSHFQNLINDFSKITDLDKQAVEDAIEEYS